MFTHATTEKEPLLAAERPLPARTSMIVVVWADGGPEHLGFPLAEGASVVLGRHWACEQVRLGADKTLSREHAEVRWDGERFHVRARSDRQGTFIDGERAHAKVVTRGACTLRLGPNLIVLLDPDAQRFDDRRDLFVDDGRYALGPEMLQLREQIAAAANQGSPVLVSGETGTGKEQMARHYYESGPRFPKGPYFALNAANLTESLADAELFGVAKGSHSGAHANKKGILEQLHGGVLFLDELHRLHPLIQGKLLRVLETKRVRPVGTSEERPADVAIVAGTNVDLRAESAERRFAGDLLQRLARHEVKLPPLRQRREEIPFLLRLFAKRIEGGVPKFTGAFVEECLVRDWSANVRELGDALASAAIRATVARSPTLEPEHLPPVYEPAPRTPSTPPAAAPSLRLELLPEAAPELCAIVECGAELAAWRRAQRLTQAELAKRLGVSERTVRGAEAAPRQPLPPSLKRELSRA
jgi:transcriptional regulator with AAA-type ATPase domain